MYIKKSVGQSGINNSKDVFFVQELLNIIADEDRRIPNIATDGKMGIKSKNAIRSFQQHIVKLKSPDSRIDPNGRTEKTLISKVVEIDQEAIPELLKKYKIIKEKIAITGIGPRNVNYRSNAKKVVSGYSENIIKLSMGYAGINKCDFSSTHRSFDDQARIMYDNCSNYSSANSVESLRTARGWGYAKTGRKVEKVYFDNKSKSADEIKKLMKDKIVEFYKKGNITSLHCVSETDYKKKNVLDIPFSSVSISKHKNFEQALMGMSAKVKNARYTQPKLGEIYISRLIIENKCWHIEIAQNNKTLPNQKKPAAPVRKKKTGASPTQISRNYVFDFLDEWF